MFLTPTDLLRLTGRRRYAAQRRALDRLGIRYLLAALLLAEMVVIAVGVLRLLK